MSVPRSSSDSVPLPCHALWPAWRRLRQHPSWYISSTTVALPAECHTWFDIRLHHRHTWTVQSYLPVGASVHPHLMHSSLDPHQSTSQMASRSVQPFLHRLPQSVAILYSGPHLSLSKLPLYIGIWTPIWDMVPWVHNANGISIESAVFAWLTIVTERPTDRPRHSVCDKKACICFDAA